VPEHLFPRRSACLHFRSSISLFYALGCGSVSPLLFDRCSFPSWMSVVQIVTSIQVLDRPPLFLLHCEYAR
jgi:hypothetical protein